MKYFEVTVLALLVGMVGYTGYELLINETKIKLHENIQCYSDGPSTNKYQPSHFVEIEFYLTDSFLKHFFFFF